MNPNSFRGLGIRLTDRYKKRRKSHRHTWEETDVFKDGSWTTTIEWCSVCGTIKKTREHNIYDVRNVSIQRPETWRHCVL